VNGRKLLETIQQMFMEMNELIDEIQTKYTTSPTLLDADDTYTLKVNVLLLLNNDSPTMHSGSCQSSQCGYKMGINITMQTDEQSKTRHILVSFVIFRGDYDAILCWPFCYPITICIMDLSGGPNHIHRSFQPDSQAAIFGRPFDNANAPYHITRFCALEKLIENGSNYVRDGDMFVKLHVDFTGTGIHPFQQKKF
jgi:hypothetical protein